MASTEQETGALTPTPKKAVKKTTTKSKKKQSFRTSKEAKPRRPATSPQWTFPKNSLEDALVVARAIEDKNAGRPMRAEDLVRPTGFRRVNDWRFLDLLKSANTYGLTSGSGTRATVSLEDTGNDIVAPSSSAQRQKALLTAFRNVEEFQRVENHYSGKRIPEGEFFENTLVRDFNIPRDRVSKFIEVFKSNVDYLNLFDARASSQEKSEGALVSAPQAKSVSSPAPQRVREFLDTCFVMMPFGEWFDRYYKEVYVLATKEAGLEPVRADELFTTGSVVEQIWGQINKSSVLLADLSDRNANVFYELGLAHAALKPVVFTANSLEHIPFDLRHLRIIIYDCREPGWDMKLAKQITEYLKAAKKDPSKSIPQPFREQYAEQGELNRTGNVGERMT